MLGQTTCEREPEMVQAMASGHETATVRAHLLACVRCRDAVAASRWMRRLADTTGETHALPDPGLLWWRAQLVRRWQAERRASAPLEAMHRAEFWTGLVSLVALVVWQGPTVWRLVSGAQPAVDPAALTRWTALLDSPNLLMALPVAGALLGLATLVTVTRFVIAE